MNHNPHNIVEGQRVALDADLANNSEVIVSKFSPNKMFATVHSIAGGNDWEVMTRRLTPINEKKPVITVKNVLEFDTPNGAGFTLDMYVDDVKTAEVSDAGDGSGYNYDILNQAKFDEVNAYIKGLPEEPVFIENTGLPFVPIGSNRQMTIKPDLDMFVSEAITKAGY